MVTPSLIDTSDPIAGRPCRPPTEASLLEILEERCQTAPDRQLYCFLDQGEFETQRLTYRQLRRRARAVAGDLQRQQILPGERVLLAYPPGLEFIAALLGTFYAGAIAVPVAPPRIDLRTGGFLIAPLAAVARDCRPAAILTGAAIAKDLQACWERWLLAEFPSCQFRVTDAIGDDQSDTFQPVEIRRETVALLQYTSGSTGDPKGVVITHGNILANEYMQQLALGHRTKERPGVGVCWLPFYHDMGLMGQVQR